MFSQATSTLIFKQFDKAACLLWATVGGSVGILGWLWTNPTMLSILLKFTSGLSTLLITSTLVAISLFFIARFSKGKMSQYAYGDFQNVLAWILPKLLQAFSVLVGLMLSAIVCWGSTNSIYALKTALICVLLAGGLLWIWGGLLVACEGLSRYFASGNEVA